jgi:hypothetical protein
LAGGIALGGTHNSTNGTLTAASTWPEAIGRWARNRQTGQASPLIESPDARSPAEFSGTRPRAQSTAEQPGVEWFDPWTWNQPLAVDARR